MKVRGIPVLPTLVVLAAAAVMVRLGLWQIDRLHQKEALLALYSRNAAMAPVIALPADKAGRAQSLFRQTALDCRGPATTSPMAGHNQRGQTGWAQWAPCLAADGKTVLAQVNLGWTTDPRAVRFGGGAIGGIIAADGLDGARVVSARALPGLQASAAPNPSDMPNNHLAYAVQWFAFAATALIIYALALRKRMRG